MAPNQWLADRREKLTTGFEKWMNRQPDYVEVAAVTLGGAVQGGAIGGMMGMITKIDPDTPQKVSNAANPAQAAVRGCVVGFPWIRRSDRAIAPRERKRDSPDGWKARTHAVVDVELTRFCATGSGRRTLGTGQEFCRDDWSECGIVACHQKGSRWSGGRPGKVRPRDGTADATRVCARMRVSSEPMADAWLCDSCGFSV